MSTIPISISKSNLDQTQYPLVTVVMPCYNAALYIREAMDSVLKQNYPNIQLLISDDASTDCTADIIREYAAKFPDVIDAQLHPKNLGLSGNVESMYPLIKGTYVSWFAGDDVYYAGKIRRQITYMQENPDCIMCCHDVDVATDDLKPLYRYNDQLLGQPVYLDHIAENLTQHRCYFSGMSIFINRDLAGDCKHIESLGPCADWFMFIELAMRGRIHYIPEVYGAYRRHDGNLTRRSKIEWEECVYAMILDRYPHLTLYAMRGLSYLYLTGVVKHAARREYAISRACLVKLYKTIQHRPSVILFLGRTVFGGIYRRMRLWFKTGSLLR